jgi:2-keto-4-pentenoate hydratase/2-oxohepta-3-ene-1,7-dioic acid hydratase in catechol pathway
MHLITYDRGGARRLGAWVGNTVVDLPDAVGHPAYPTSMEALVSRNGGTTLEAAVHALADPAHVAEALVPDPELLVPILPVSLRKSLAFGEPMIDRLFRTGPGPANGSPRRERYEVTLDGGAHLSVLGPDAELVWPAGAANLDYELEVACVIGKPGRVLSPEEAESVIFGYTLMGAWSADPVAAGPIGDAGRDQRRAFAASLGPCVVTADEFDPSNARLTARVDGEVWSEGNLRRAQWTFAQMLSSLSQIRDLRPGDVYGSGTFLGGSGRDLGRALRPGAVVELEAEGIGVLRTRLGLSPAYPEPAA